jgi:hypothetical protein
LPTSPLPSTRPFLRAEAHRGGAPAIGTVDDGAGASVCPWRDFAWTVTRRPAIGCLVADARVRRRLPRPELSYSSGFSKNVEFLVGPWSVLLGSFIYVEISLHPVDLLPDQAPPPPNWIPLIFVVLGLVFCYFAYFRRVFRLEINDETLYWFLPFRRLKGQAPIADIVSVWTGQTLQWSITRTVIDLRDGRSVSVRDSRGIGAFVFALIARSPDINLADWETRDTFDRSEGIGSFYDNDDE